MLSVLRAGAVLAFGASAMAATTFSAEQYASGEVHMNLRSRKEASVEKQRQAGALESSQYRSIDERVRCENGLAVAFAGDANSTFRCNNIDLFSFKSHADLGSALGEGSSSWGWTSDDGREFVAIGQSDGASFAEITKEGQLVYLGRLPQTSTPIIWREIRAYKNYMVIGSEAEGHNIQIFDMKKILDIDPAKPVTFDPIKDLTGYFTDLPVGRTHNVVVNEELGYAVAVGAAPRNSECAAGLIFIDLTDPSNPTSPGCDAQDGYVHDAQCLVYRGPDEKYAGRDICYGYNENSLTIYDVTDKTNSTLVSNTTYDGATYVHQGWVLDPEWQTFILQDDELDEVEKAGAAADGRATTYIWNITSLEKPIMTGTYKSSQVSIDHNQYVANGFVYQSNYGAGLRVLAVDSIPDDPTGAGVEEVAFFDMYPEDDATPEGGLAEFVGTWSSYALFKSGWIFINTIERGGWVVRRTDVPGDEYYAGTQSYGQH